MKVTKNQLRRIIKEEIATINKDTIEDTVMSVLSDEGGAAGIEPIESALEELEDEEISLPEDSIEDIIGDVPGVKRHEDGDYIDTTKLESRKIRITKNQLKRIIREEKARFLRESMEELPPPGADRKQVVGTDATILAEDYIRIAVHDGLEELGLTEEQAGKVIQQLNNRSDILREVLFGGLEDYKRKLGMTGRPKPRSM